MERGVAEAQALIEEVEEQQGDRVVSQIAKLTDAHKAKTDKVRWVCPSII